MAKTQFLVSLLLLLLCLSFARTFLSLSLSFCRFLLESERAVAEHPSHSLFSWLPLTRGKLLGNAITFATTPPPSSSLPPTELLPFLAHNVLPRSTTRLKSSGSSTAANCRTVRQVDGTLPHVTKHTPRVILANNTGTFEFHHDNSRVMLRYQSLNKFNALYYLFPRVGAGVRVDESEKF